MGLSDRLKDLKTKATDAAVERSEQIHDAVEKVATTADQRTGGKYSEHIQKVGAKADSLVESLKGADGQAPPADPQGTQAQPEAAQAQPEAAQAQPEPAQAQPEAADGQESAPAG
jgi:DNA-binding protein H-NS